MLPVVRAKDRQGGQFCPCGDKRAEKRAAEVGR